MSVRTNPSNQSRTVAVIAVAALVLGIVEWVWLSWQRENRLSTLRQEIETLRGDLAVVRRTAGTADSGEGRSLSDERLQQCLADLGDSSIIARYEAGMILRDYGDKAVPGLLALVSEGNSRAQQAALLLLGDLRSPASAPSLRELAQREVRGAGSAEAGSGAAQLDATTLAGVLGVLVRLEDKDSIPIFRQALGDCREVVCAAAVAGLRDTSAVVATPDLAGLLDHESVVVRKEAERAIRKFCENDPGSLVANLSAGPPSGRFRALRFLKDEKSDASRQALRGLLEDADPRVALGAARVLADSDDEAVRQTVRRVASSCPSSEVRHLAREVLTQLDKSELGGVAAGVIETMGAAQESVNVARD